MIVTDENVRQAASNRGGFTAAQIRYAQKAFPGKWKQALIGTNVTEAWWDGFVNLKKKPKQAKNNKPQVINSISTNRDSWEWKPEQKDIPAIKILNKNKGKSGRKKERYASVSRQDNENFYKSREWLELRVRVLEKYECKCMMCGMSPKYHGIVIHVDHIEPRSKRPDLSLRINNLQLLCADCNRGKSNKYSTDWRPDSDSDELDLMMLSNPNAIYGH